MMLRYSNFAFPHFLESTLQLHSNSDRCDHLNQPSTGQFVISCMLIAWMVLSYIPQWHRIISRRSAEGLSTLYVLLGAASGICAVANILILPASQVDRGCCRTNTRFACIAGTLGMVQVLLGVALFWTVYVHNSLYTRLI